MKLHVKNKHSGKEVDGFEQHSDHNEDENHIDEDLDVPRSLEGKKRIKKIEFMDSKIEMKTGFLTATAKVFSFLEYKNSLAQVFSRELNFAITHISTSGKLAAVSGGNNVQLIDFGDPLQFGILKETEEVVIKTVWMQIPVEVDEGDLGEGEKTSLGLMTVTPSKAVCTKKDKTVVFQVMTSSDRMTDITMNQSTLVILCVSGAVHVFDIGELRGDIILDSHSKVFTYNFDSITCGNNKLFMSKGCGEIWSSNVILGSSDENLVKARKITLKKNKKICFSSGWTDLEGRQGGVAGGHRGRGGYIHPERRPLLSGQKCQEIGYEKVPRWLQSEVLYCCEGHLCHTL
jgi:hypothetical protein